MVHTVIFNVDTKNSNGRTFTLNVTDKSYVNSIITVKDNNSITEDDVTKLQQAAARNGDFGILEACDLNGDEKLNLAMLQNFSKYYDIKLSDDKKYFEVKVKNAGTFIKNPSLGTIKKDFGIRDNVLVTKDRGIPYGNESVIREAGQPGTIGDGSKEGIDYDKAVIKVGKTINIPVDEINITDTPCGFWGRL